MHLYFLSDCHESVEKYVISLVSKVYDQEKNSFFSIVQRKQPSPSSHKPIASEGKKRLLSALVLCLSGLNQALPLFVIKPFY
ncbi:hypothetical protein F4694_002032 [Bacillus niacini]|jgi:hypothetical protein|uniref:Uncharacterized protein n=1 Tax=Neobacillus niacini TaxID=86668 RepID=A0A852TBD5_9BACI|nr:hypothetical protein [Neobacillus niacini]